MTRNPSDPREPLTQTPTGQRVRIASRGSQLARWQAQHVAGLLRQQGVDSEIIYLTTTGDRVQDRFLHEIGGKGLFTKEIEEALLNGTADIAVHSLKDMPARVSAPFVIAAHLKRHSPRDLMIFRPVSNDPHGQPPALATSALESPQKPLTADEIAGWPAGTIATGSLRRRQLLARANPGLQAVPIRGNVDTRLKKLSEGQWQALILAEASLDRLDIKQNWPCRPLDPQWFIPAPAQGILAIESLVDYPRRDLLSRLNCAETQREAEIERGLLAALGGDCTLPYGCYCRTDGAADENIVRAGLHVEGTGWVETTLHVPLQTSIAQVLKELAAGLCRADTGGGVEKLLLAANVKDKTS